VRGKVDMPEAEGGMAGGGQVGGGQRGSSERRRALECLRVAMSRQRKYITAICNMAHLLSLDADTVMDASMLNLQASLWRPSARWRRPWQGGASAVLQALSAQRSSARSRAISL